MALGPTPQTEFESWGQGVYRSTPPRGANLTTFNRRSLGTLMLFAVSDVKRQWLGWYVLRTDGAKDSEIMGNLFSTYAEKASRPFRFSMPQPITVEELIGP